MEDNVKKNPNERSYCFPWNKYDQPIYVSPSPGVMPVMAIGTPWIDNGTYSLSTLKVLKGLGVTYVQDTLRSPKKRISQKTEKSNPLHRVSNKELLTELLENAHQAGVRAMVRVGGTSGFQNPETEEGKLAGMEKWLKDVYLPLVSLSYNEEATAGWMILDTPSEILFSILNKAQSEIEKVDAWRHIVYNNLKSAKSFERMWGKEGDDQTWRKYDIPSVDDTINPSLPAQLQPEYKKYIAKAIKELKPSVLSSAFYAFDNHFVKAEYRSGFFQNLDIYRRLSYMIQRPFWGYVFGCFEAPEGKDMNEYLDKMLACYRFEAYCALAFGAQGMCWWRVVADTNSVYEKDPITGESIEVGYQDKIDVKECSVWQPLSQMGTKTSLGDKMKDVNTQIQKASDVFLGCSVDECRFSGKLTISHPKNGGVYDPFKYFKSGKDAMPFGPLVSLISPNSGQYNRYFLMSLLTNNGKTFMVFVSTDIRDLPTAGIKTTTQSARVTFTCKMKRLAIGSQSSEIILEKNVPYDFSLRFGDWAIFEVM